MTKIYIQKIDQSQGAVLISYELTNLDSCQISYDMGITTNPLPENADDQTILVKVTGNSTSKDLAFVIKNENINKFSGHLVGSNVSTKTMWEQLRFFDDPKGFQSSGIGDTYRIVIADQYTWDGTYSVGSNIHDVYTNEYFRKEGVTDKMTFTLTSLEPVSIRATFNLQVGTNVVTLDANTPTEPLNIIATDAGSHHASISWSAPTDAGGSAITTYIIQRKTQATPFITVLTIAYPATGTVDTSSTSGTYTYRIAAQNSQGIGLYSDEVDVTIA